VITKTRTWWWQQAEVSKNLIIFSSMSNNEAGSVSPKCPDIDDSTWESDKSIVIQSQSQDDLDVGVRTPLSSHLRQESVVETTEAVLGRLSTVSHTDNTSNLDWALVELRIPEISPHILAHVSGGLEVSTCMVGIAPTEAAVLVITGSNGIMRGTMSRSLTFMQLPNTVAFQEMWTVRLDGIVCEWNTLSSTSLV
jgi:hypothetical protein